jgi:hypothetical protein
VAVRGALDLRDELAVEAIPPGPDEPGLAHPQLGVGEAARADAASYTKVGVLETRHALCFGRRADLLSA